MATYALICIIEIPQSMNQSATCRILVTSRLVTARHLMALFASHNVPSVLVVLIQRMGMNQVMPVLMAALQFFLPMAEPSRRQARISEEIRPLFPVVGRLTGHLGNRTAPAVHGTNQILAATRVGNPVGLSHGMTKLGQNDDGRPEPDGLNGMQGFEVVARAVGMTVVDARMLRPEIFEVLAEVLQIHIVVVIEFVHDAIQSSPPDRVGRGIFGQAILVSGSQKHEEESEEDPRAGGAFVGPSDGISAPTELHAGQDLSHENLGTTHGIPEGGMADSFG